MAQASSGPGADARPLSPHLQVYTPLINMVMSILHRITGAALYFGTVLLVGWLLAVVGGATAYDSFMRLLNTIPGKIVLIGYTWALMHHALGGIRHLIWDTGRGFGLGTVNALSWFTILGSLALTAAIWGAIFNLRGFL